MRTSRLVAGIMSGTSLDGIDAVLLRVRESGPATGFRQIARVHRKYQPALRAMLLRCSDARTGRVDDITRLNSVLAVLYARAVRSLARSAGLPLARIDLIGCHGQTIHHLPVPARTAGVRIGATLQIGDPSVLATLTGIPTVGDFRQADVAAGGQGAPLVPYVDWLIFRSRKRNRIMLNLGGIANVTVLQRRCRPEEVIAFDTGPGNMVIDGLMRRLYDRDRDAGGGVARGGMVIHDLFEWMCRHPFLRRRPPKSTGREEFGDVFLEALLDRARGHDPADIVATATAFTAWSVHDACTRWIRPQARAGEVLVSGGGVHNRAVMEGLKRHFGPKVVRTTDEFGISAGAKEAVCFALLACETARGRPANLPSVTGASRPVVLGVMCRPGGGTRGRRSTSTGW